jgi:type III pantothenate kinase
MNAAVVVDVGNSRIKWGRCAGGAVVETVSLPPDDPLAWRDQREHWQNDLTGSWVLTGVHPDRCNRLAEWLTQQGETVRIIRQARELPLHVDVEYPDRVGLDRLLNAVAANSRRAPGVPAVLVDAGTAVTVDWVDEQGAFGGGAIFPGLRLMAQALHNYTALLPLIEVGHTLPTMPGRSTPAAMEAGIYWTVVGGIRTLCAELAGRRSTPALAFLTGGDGPALHAALGPEVIAWPQMTLEGIRLTAESLP